MKSEKTLKWIFLALVLSLGIALRFLPHPPNFSVIGSIALFSGFLFSGSVVAFLIPVSILLLSDALLGFYPGFVFVYAGFFLFFAVGTFCTKRNLPLISLPIGSLTASLIFFFLTNFGHWLVTNMYPKTLEGLGMAYVAGIPFLKWSMLGDFLFSSVFMLAFLGLHKFFLPSSRAV